MMEGAAYRQKVRGVIHHELGGYQLKIEEVVDNYGVRLKLVVSQGCEVAMKRQKGENDEDAFRKRQGPVHVNEDEDAAVVVLDEVVGRGMGAST